MAIEKAPGFSPLDNITKETTPLDAPRVIDLEDGSTEFDFSEHEDLEEDLKGTAEDFYGNLAEFLDEDVLQRIAGDAYERFKNDQMSNKKWMDTVKDGFNLLGTSVDETNDPFPGACAAHHPLILESAVKFQAKASNELFSPKGPVKTQVFGTLTPEKEEQAARVRAHLNYQVMDQMKEYFDEQETLLFYLPIIGSCFKKVYYSTSLQRPVSEYVPADKLVVSYHATNLERATLTHVLIINAEDLKRDQVNGFYREVDLVQPSDYGDEGDLTRAVDDIMGFSPSETDRSYVVLEQHVFLDIPEDPYSDPDGVALPYLVSFEKDSQKVLSIRRGWDENDPKKLREQTFVHYKFVPGMGFYGLGYIHLLGNLQIVLTSTMRSLLDSGVFANLNAGFVDKRLRIRDDGPLAPGQFKEVEAGGIPLEQAIKLIPFKEPSITLMRMYQLVEERSQRFADTTEQMVADSTNYGPVGTTMALLEASSKFFSGVHKRLHNSQKQEFNILARLNYQYLGENYEFDVVGQTFNVSKQDYDGRVDVVPQSDPNISSQAQRMTQAQTIYTAALQNPQIHDLRAVTKEYYESLGVDTQKIAKFLPDPEEPQPLDPLSDISTAQQGKPIKAFPGQDHDAHVAIKTAFLQDPSTGANPVMQMVAPVLQANIQEHLILKFQESVQGTLQSEGQDPSAANEQVIAQAAQKVAQTNQRLMQLEQEGVDAAKTKLADAELIRAQNEGRELQAKMTKDNSDQLMDYMRFNLEQQKEENRVLIEAAKLDVQVMSNQMVAMQELLNQVLANTQKDNDRSSKERMAESAAKKKEEKPKSPKKPE